MTHFTRIALASLKTRSLRFALFASFAFRFASLRFASLRFSLRFKTKIHPQGEAGHGTIRNEFTPLNCTEGDSSCVDSRDTEGLPANHNHLDRGASPNADYKTLATGGGGGAVRGGAPGASGSYSIALDALGSSSQSEASPRSVRAGVGLSRMGGRGADGKEAGGGGGGGFVGGGGGGSGVDGAGGGGGAGYVDLGSVYDGEYEDEWARGMLLSGPEEVPRPRLWMIGSERAGVEWTDNTEGRGRDRIFDVEIASGRDSAGGERDADCDDEYILSSRHVRVSAAARNNSYSRQLIKDLQPNTVYCVKVTAISVDGKSTRSQPLRFVTSPEPIDEWARVSVRRAKGASSGRGSSSRVLERPHVSEEVGTRGGESTWQNKKQKPHTNNTNTNTNTHSLPHVPGGKSPSTNRTYDGPSANANLSPSARRGHTLSNIHHSSHFGDDNSPTSYVYLFGGVSDGYVCDVGGTQGAKDLGDTPAGLSAESCRKHAGVSNDLWRLDASSGVWSIVFESETGSSTLNGPRAREGHTSSVMGDGRLVVFGGVAPSGLPGHDPKGEKGELQVSATPTYTSTSTHY